MSQIRGAGGAVHRGGEGAPDREPGGHVHPPGPIGGGDAPEMPQEGQSEGGHRRGNGQGGGGGRHGVRGRARHAPLPASDWSAVRIYPRFPRLSGLNGSTFVDRHIRRPSRMEGRAESSRDARSFHQACALTTRAESMLLCDGCDLGYHMNCVNPPLAAIPEGDWFCPGCAAARPRTAEAPAEAPTGEAPTSIADQRSRTKAPAEAPAEVPADGALAPADEAASAADEATPTADEAGTGPVYDPAEARAEAATIADARLQSLAITLDKVGHERIEEKDPALGDQSQGTREHITGVGTNHRGVESVFQGLEPRRKVPCPPARLGGQRHRNGQLGSLGTPATMSNQRANKPNNTNNHVRKRCLWSAERIYLQGRPVT
eukprot:1192991-Prorocentrum_minimum.AAC.2